MSASTNSVIWHPFTQHGVEGPMRDIAAADGAWLTARDGARIFDAISSWWVVTHGHRHPKIVAAIQEQCEKLDQVIFAGFTHEPAERAAAGLVACAPGTLAHVFFSDSGSTAVEVALKMALGFWRNRGEKRTRILALEHAYHGDTIGTMSAGARGVFNVSYAPLLFEVGRVPFPEAGRERATLDALDAECRKGDVAALVVEPLILGAGGMRMYEPRILAEIRAICSAYGVLFIADEVMTGFGRTGRMFACDLAGLAPDILCLAKGLTGGSVPLAATLATPEIFDAHFSSDRAKTFFHSSSYTANPICCAAAAANLDIWKSEPVARRIDDLALAQAEECARLKASDMFDGVRHLGTLAAFEWRSESTGYTAQIALTLRQKFLDRGVLLRPLGGTVYVMPPYCTTREELSKVYDAILAVADEVRP